MERNEWRKKALPVLEYPGNSQAYRKYSTPQSLTFHASAYMTYNYGTRVSLQRASGAARDHTAGMVTRLGVSRLVPA